MHQFLFSQYDDPTCIREGKWAKLRERKEENLQKKK